MIAQYIQPLLTYLHQHPHTGLVFTFFVAFLESLPIIGTIFPGSITMTLIGLLVGSGAMPGFLTIGISSIAAFMGDLIGYMAGYHYNDRIRTIWPFRKHPKWLIAGEAFFKKHGGKSIVIGRFFGPARSTVPLIAGLMKLSLLRFSVAAVPSAILWAFVYLSPGIVLGAIALEIPHAKMGEFIIYGLLSLGLIFFAYWLIQHFFLQLARGINAGTDALWGYLSLKKSRSACHIILTIILGAGSIVLFKSISYSLRPQGFRFIPNSSSFPSGHTAMTFVITTVSAFLIAQVVSKNVKWISFTCAGIFILLVTVSRLYLGAHWFSDVIGSIFLGFSVLLIC